jgi:hypothetical protein
MAIVGIMQCTLCTKRLHQVCLDSQMSTLSRSKLNLRSETAVVPIGQCCNDALNHCGLNRSCRSVALE